MFCFKCGTKAIDGAVFCQKCGAKLIQDNREEQRSTSTPKRESEEMAILSAEAISEPEQKSAKEEGLLPESEPIQIMSSKPIERSAAPVGSTVVSSSEPAWTSTAAIELAQAPSSESVGTSVSSREPIVETAQDVNIQEESFPMSGSDADIYALAKENIGMCPAIKSAKQFKKGVRLHGKIYSHSVRLVTVHAVQARLRSVLAFPFAILYGLLTGLLCATTGVILQELVKYGSICIEYYHGILLALCCLVAGAIVLIHTLVGRKEKDAVENYVREIVESKQIYLFERKWVGAPAKKTVAAIVLVVAGIIILPLSLPEPVEYPDELLFDGLPAVRFLEMTQKDVELEFGEKGASGKNRITAGEYYNYIDIEHVTYSKETGKIIYIEFWGSHCSYNRKNLDRSIERVLDILTEGDWYCVPPMRHAFEVYGSIHSGFYYDDGEYISEYVGPDYRWQHGLEGSTHYQVFPLHTYGEKDYKMALTTVRWENDDSPLELHKVCLYTDEWVETVNAAAVSLDQTCTNEADSSNTREVLYDGIPVSQFFVLSAGELVETFGTAIVYDEHMLAYDDIEFSLDNGKITSAESFSLGKFTVNGDTLEKGRDELIALLGNPSDEGEGGSGYQLEFSLEDCKIVIAMDEDTAWRVWLTPPQYQSDDFGYLTKDNLTGTTGVVRSWNEAADVVYGWLDSHPLGWETELDYSNSAIVTGSYPIQLVIKDDYIGETFIGTIFVSVTDGSMIITVPAMDDAGEWTKSYDYSIDQWYRDIWMSVGDV